MCSRRKIMTSEPTTNPVEKPAARPRSAQDRKMERDIIAAGQLAGILPTETELAADLAEGGYTTVELTRFGTLQQKALADFVTQGQVEAEQKAATQNYQAADKAARAAYAKLRGLGKSAFMKDPVGRQFVGLDGREPDGLQSFLGAARKLTMSGKEPGYAEKLAKKGVTAAKLSDLGAKLDALEAADAAQEAAKAAAPKARARRDQSAKELFDWVSEFKVFAKAQFKDHPDALKRWGF
jgi:hypothetical protein